MARKAFRSTSLTRGPSVWEKGWCAFLCLLITSVLLWATDWVTIAGGMWVLGVVPIVLAGYSIIKSIASPFFRKEGFVVLYDAFLVLELLEVVLRYTLGTWWSGFLPPFVLTASFLVGSVFSVGGFIRALRGR